MLLDLSPQQLTGKFADALLGQHHITVNKNRVPSDPQSPFITSGIRIGTPAITTRGMNTQDMQQIANWIADMLLAPENQSLHIDIKHQVEHLCHSHPVYEGRELWI
jgi:glycine hydroxymethyltransferase